MQKLDNNKKLFLQAQRSTERYGFVDTSVSHEETNQDTVDVDVDGNYFVHILYKKTIIFISYYEVNISRRNLLF